MLIYGRLNIYCFVHLASFRHCLNVNPLQKLPIVWPSSLSLLFDLELSSGSHNSVSPDIKLRLDRPGHLTHFSVSLRPRLDPALCSSGCPQTRKVRTGPGSLSGLTSLAPSNCQTIKNMSIVFCISCSSSTLYIIQSHHELSFILGQSVHQIKTLSLCQNNNIYNSYFPLCNSFWENFEKII